MTYGIAASSATKNDSLNGVVKGDITPVAIRLLPAGSFASSGCATKLKISLELSTHGMKAMPIATSARSSRLRSSRRCEISVPSTSFSGSALIDARPQARRSDCARASAASASAWLSSAGCACAGAAGCSGATEAAAVGAGGRAATGRAAAQDGRSWPELWIGGGIGAGAASAAGAGAAGAASTGAASVGAVSAGAASADAAVVVVEPGGGARRRASSSCTSSSSCSRNCRAMARARPIQRPISEATRGSFSGPSTTSARTKMIRTSRKRPSNRSDAPVVLRLGGLSRLGLGLMSLVEFGVGAFRADLLRRGGLLRLAVVHGLLEPTHRGAQVLPHGPQLLGAEHDEHDQQDDQQLAHSYTAHNVLTPLRPARAQERLRNHRSNEPCRAHKFGEFRYRLHDRRPQDSSQNVTGPSLISDTSISAPNTPAETGA